MSKTNPSTSSLRIFTVLWVGQLISTLGSGLTGFALGVWIYQQTHSTTLYALNLLAYALPNLLVAPLAGALVDRWSRRWVMILSDAGAGLSTVILASLYLTHSLQIWQVFLLTAMYSGFTALMWPAFSAVTTLLIPKEHLGRAGGMVQIGEAVSQLISPVAAGVLLLKAGLAGVVLLDGVSFLVAIVTTVIVSIPSVTKSPEADAAPRSFTSDLTYGWKYISTRPGLLGLLSVFAITNLMSGFIGPLIVPMLLKITTADRLGLLMSLLGIGMLLGTLGMSAWGGPKRRINGVLGFMIIGGIFSAMIGVSLSLVVIGAAGFLMMLLQPVINGSSQAIWQTKVPPEAQGRVFSVRRMIAWSVMPLSYLLAGPLSDRLFEPLLMPGGLLADSLGRVMGTGPGHGTGLLFIVLGLISALVPALAYLFPQVRNLEDELPDAVAPKAVDVGEKEALAAAPAD